jgi:hypothetical protein
MSYLTCDFFIDHKVAFLTSQIGKKGSQMNLILKNSSIFKYKKIINKQITSTFLPTHP